MGRKAVLEVFKREVSIEYLSRTTKQTDERANDALAALLDDHPLALDQAAAFILEAPISVSDYIALFRENPLKMLDTGTRSQGYEDTVATTWNLAFQRISESPAASDLLGVIAHCETDKLPRSLFLHCLKALPPALRSNIALHQAIARLRSFSLVKVEEDAGIRMHRLVRQIVRDQQALQAPQTFQRCKSVADQLHQRQNAIDYLTRRVQQSDPIAGNRLADLLGDHPLALSQAAAYIVESKVSLKDYVTLLESSKPERYEKVSAPSPARTFEIAFERIRSSPAAVDLLAIVSHCDVPAVFIKVLHRPDVLPASLRSEAALKEAIDRLQAYALLSVSGDEISMHLLVRESARKRFVETSNVYSSIARALYGQDSPVSSVEPLAYPTYHVKLVNVSCLHARRTVLSRINLEIPYHRITSLIGPGGSGKSTLLRLLVGNQRFMRNMRLLGSIEPHPRVGKGAALVTGEPLTLDESVYHSFVPRLKVWEKVSGRFRPLEREERIERSLKRVLLWDNVKDKLGKSVLLLPPGQQRQLKLAHAICTDPDFLLLDAMTFDTCAQGAIDDFLLELKDRCTIILVPTTMQEAALVSDFTAFLLLGRLMEFDKTSVIFMRPARKETEDFVTGRYG